jgi:hypothetical protein
MCKEQRPWCSGPEVGDLGLRAVSREHAGAASRRCSFPYRSSAPSPSGPVALPGAFPVRGGLACSHRVPGAQRPSRRTPSPSGCGIGSRRSSHRSRPRSSAVEPRRCTGRRDPFGPGLPRLFVVPSLRCSTATGARGAGERQQRCASEWHDRRSFLMGEADREPRYRRFCHRGLSPWRYGKDSAFALRTFSPRAQAGCPSSGDFTSGGSRARGSPPLPLAAARPADRLGGNGRPVPPHAACRPLGRQRVEERVEVAAGRLQSPLASGSHNTPNGTDASPPRPPTRGAVHLRGRWTYPLKRDRPAGES